jgi:DNA-binding MarR family transcriptional regulator
MRKGNRQDRDAEQRELSLLMKRLITGYKALLETMIEQEGITLAQIRMLNALSERSDVSAAELARICYITPQSMQAVVKRAVGAGWITRSPSPVNRRVLTATLTPTGRRVLLRGLALSAKVERYIWADAKSSERRVMKRSLETAMERLQAQTDAHNAEHHGRQQSPDRATGAATRKTA